MQVTSSAFRDGESIPAKYSCEGDDVSPPLSWSDVPAGTKSLALIVADPDAPDPAHPTRTWVHWVLADLPPDETGLPEDAGDIARGCVGTNDWQAASWGGPCPPIGRHRYMFTLYALDRVLGLAHPTKAELEQAMAGRVLAQATLTGTYEKRGG
jgi:Raf kinase inhibitor-like YbhB/YbcL family protein